MTRRARIAGLALLGTRCESCHAEHLVAFICKRRGFCPSCGARRMAESAALLIDEVLPQQPMRQWVLSFPYPLRFLFATRPAIMGQVLGIVYRVIATHRVKKAGMTHKTARTGAVTLIQRFGSALNLNIHFQCCSSMACTSIAPTARPGFAGSRRLPVLSSPNWRTPSPSVWVASSNAKAGLHGTPRMVTSPGMR